MVWNDPDIDCVVIATPASTHAAIAREALVHRKHILVEKPMATSTAEAFQLEAMVAKSNRVFMVGFTYIFNDYIRFLKKEIDAHALGALRVMRAEHRHGPERPDVNSFWDAAPHPLSVFNYLFHPQELVSAHVQTATRKLTSATLRFDRRPLLHITTESGSPKKVRIMTLEGERKTATLDETRETNALTFSSGLGPHIRATEPLRNELKHFVQCIKTNQQPITDVHFGVRVTEWLEAVSPPNSI